ncbi:hypothetical protein RJT34_26379 [Clitoria ternatea]|uniref:Secreted protein n=1 Tax=Clitoria ternatea TaxID=43366 RepID=A0AAN9IFQ3_CLITE
MRRHSPTSFVIALRVVVLVMVPSPVVSELIAEDLGPNHYLSLSSLYISTKAQPFNCSLFLIFFTQY